jgi:hypothetical protein
METRKRVLGAEHPDTLTSMNNLAFTQKGFSRDAEAITLIKECSCRNASWVFIILNPYLPQQNGR